MNQDIIAELTEVLRQRQGADADESYVASLYAKGINKILEKVGEEATEVIIAAKDHAAGSGSEKDAGSGPEKDASSKPDNNTDSKGEALTNEVADLWFHTLVMLVHQGIDPAEVLKTLSDRFGLSGHAEKAQRGKSKD